MTMQQRRPAPLAPTTAFGTLPPAATTLSIERALELAGVDATELALLASTTFKEARSLEELVTLIATTRRRGLDGMLRHVYYERFGGRDSDPSLHVAIDGLRAIAANTGRYGGRLEPRFFGTWRMPIDDQGHEKPVPEKCVVTVYAIVKGRHCAFEGVAWMEEAYPGAGARGRMWRQRPRGMLAIAAERQALRSAFPAETSGVGDVEDEGDVIDVQPVPPVARTRVENAAAYTRIYGSDDDPPMLVDTTTGEVLEQGGSAALVREAEASVRLDGDTHVLPVSGPSPASPEPGEPPAQPPEQAAPDRQEPPPRRQPAVTVRSALGQRFAELVEEAARLEVPFDDLKLEFPAAHEHVVRNGEKLRDRIDVKKAQLAEPVARESEPIQETLV